MAAYGPFPGIEMEYDLNGCPVDDANNKLSDSAAAQTLIDAIRNAEATDLFVISHGWNNDKVEARRLYGDFFSTAADLVNSGAIAVPSGRKGFVMAILWPSARFVDPADIPGGAAGADDSTVGQIQAQLRVLRDAYNGDAATQATIDAALALVPKLDDPNTQQQFVKTLGALPAPDPQENDTITKSIDTAASPETDGTALLQNLSANAGAAGGVVGGAAVPGGAPAAGGNGDAGGAAFNVLGSITSGALAFAKVLTYRTMKARAGMVGQTGAVTALMNVRAVIPALRIHLIGHSFGGRLVTSIANAFSGADTAHSVSSMSLLQAAFSHFGFALNYLATGHNGAFRDVVAKPTVSGTVIITHSVHDMAVGWAYPAASLILGQVASGVAELNPFGGMGTDGAVTTPEAVFEDMLDVGQTYTALPQKLVVRNLNGDKYISGHGDVTGKQVVYAVLNNAFA